MKIIPIILITVLSIMVSCELEDAGKTDCAIALTEYLDQSEDDYLELMALPDRYGNHQSLEACLNRRALTEGYLARLIEEESKIDDQEGCTIEEKSQFSIRISDRIIDLEEDMDSTWDHCEEVYGGD